MPHAWHAAVVRSQLAACPHHRRRFGGARPRQVFAACSRGRTSHASHDRSRRDRVPDPALRGCGRRPPATSASRSRSSSRGTATSPRTRPSSSPSTTSRSIPSSTRRDGRTDPRSLLPLRGRRRGAGRRRPRRPLDVPRPALHVPPARVLRRRLRLGRADRGRLTAWANFQGPFSLHGVAAAALGLRGDRFRLLTPPDSGGSFGIKACGAPVRRADGARRRAQLGVPVRWTEDRVEHLAAQRRRNRSRHQGSRRASRATGSSSRCATTPSRTSARMFARRSRRRSTGCTGRCPGAYRVRNVAARNRVVLTNTIPSGLNRGFGGPAALLRPGADDGDRRAAARHRPSRAGAGAISSPADEMPYRTPSGAPLRLGRLRGLPRSCARALGVRASSRARAAAAREAGKLAGVGLACVVEPSISNMGYITLAQTAVERATVAPKSGQRRGRVRRDRPERRDQRPRRHHASGPGASHGVRPGGCGRARVRARRRHRAGRSSTPRPPRGRSRRATTRRGSRESASRRSRPRRARSATRSTRSASTPATPTCRCAVRRAWRTGTPKGFPTAWSRVLRPSRFASAPNLDPPDAEDRVASSGAHGFIVDVCAVEVDRDDGRRDA